MESNSFLRRIQSFVRRENRMTSGQKRALESFWPMYGIDGQDRLNTETIWLLPAPLVLEIGVGMGEALLHMASVRPELNFLGVDVYRPGLGVIVNALHEQHVTNVRLICGDVIKVLEDQLLPGSLSEIHIYFPDPWPKKRHHKRRLVQATFLDQIYTMLTPQGKVYLATDWEHYAQQMLAVFQADKRFTVLLATNDPASRSLLRPVTKFERRAQQEGRQVWEFIIQKKELREGEDGIT